MFDFSDIPIIDHHAHPWLAPAHALTRDSFRMRFTEGTDPALAAGVPSSLFYQAMIRELAAVLECRAIEIDILAARKAIDPRSHAARLARDAQITAAILDDGYAGRSGGLLSLHEMTEWLGAPVYRAPRLETLLEDLVNTGEDVDAVEERFRTMLDRQALRAAGVVCLKSIVAYRSGLAVGPPDRNAMRSTHVHYQRQVARGERVRIADQEYLGYFLWVALRWAALNAFPIQFHTGFGDPDLNLLHGANPLAMRPIFEAPDLRDVPIVLLHAGYPYVRETGYLASVYPNVCIDVGLAIPFAITEYDDIWRQTLSLAPVDRVLFSTDGFDLPELSWFAAIHGRRSLARTMAMLVERDIVASNHVEEIAHAVLHDNARRLYGLTDDDVTSL